MKIIIKIILLAVCIYILIGISYAIKWSRSYNPQDTSFPNNTYTFLINTVLWSTGSDGQDMAHKDQTPTRKLQPISKQDILGIWAPSYNGEDGMEFSITEKEEYKFDSWLNDHPSFSGEWSLVGNTLTIFGSDPPYKEVFVAEIQGNTLLLEDSTGTINASVKQL